MKLGPSFTFRHFALARHMHTYYAQRNQMSAMTNDYDYFQLYAYRTELPRCQNERDRLRTDREQLIAERDKLKADLSACTVKLIDCRDERDVARRKAELLTAEMSAVKAKSEPPRRCSIDSDLSHSLNILTRALRGGSSDAIKKAKTGLDSAIVEQAKSTASRLDSIEERLDSISRTQTSILLALKLHSNSEIIRKIALDLIK